MSRDGCVALPCVAMVCLRFVIVVFPDHTRLFFYGLVIMVILSVKQYFFYLVLKICACLIYFPEIAVPGSREYNKTRPYFLSYYVTVVLICSSNSQNQYSKTLLFPDGMVYYLIDDKP